MTGVWILVGALMAALAFGLYRAATDGRFRGTHQIAGPAGEVGRAGRGSSRARVETPAPTQGADPIPSGPTTWSQVSAAAPDAVLGDRATLVQFSTAFCAPCRATRRILGDIATAVPGVTHVEIDAEHHLDLVRSLGVTRTPTTLVLDGSGREITRASGAPRKEQVLAVLPVSDDSRLG